MDKEPPSSQPDERRARPRSPVVVQETRVIAGADVFFGCALNVSRNGLFISGLRRRSPGEVHEIRFRLPGLDRTFVCRAEVAWTRAFEQGSRLPPGFGLKFLDLSAEDLADLDRWVEAAQAAEEPD